MCNVDALIDALELDREEFYEINVKVCWDLADEFNLGEDAKPRIEIRGSL